MYCLNDPINYIDPDGFMGRPNNAPFGPLSRADWLAQNAGLIDQVRQWAMAANRYDPEQFLNTINFRITNDHGTHQDVTATFMHNNDSHEVDFIMGTAQELLNYSASRMRNEITPSTRRSGLQDLGGALLDIIPGVAFFRTLATVGGIQQDSRSLGTHIYDIASPIVARGQSNRQIFIMTQSRRNGQVRWPDWNSNTNRAWY
ncbi:MAG: hypothetical protein FWD06_09930 [Oscillospiraceae bacterium]|nr:hypothetical protein [Oscillospiraceae bacterium]